MQKWYTGFLSINNFGDIIPLPHVPPDFPVDEPEYDNEVYDGLSKQYVRIGKPKLRSWEWSSYIPLDGERYFNGILFGNARQMIDKIRDWREKRVPVRFILSDRNYVAVINTACVIDKFDASISKVGRVEYTIKLTEYNFVV